MISVDTSIRIEKLPSISVQVNHEEVKEKQSPQLNKKLEGNSIDFLSV